MPPSKPQGRSHGFFAEPRSSSRSGTRSSSSARRSTTPIGWRRIAAATSRTSCMRRWPQAGWLGIAMPEEHGGAGLGITEAAIMMQAIAESGAAMSGASAVHMNIFGLQPVVVFGTDEQKRRMLPPLIAGKDKACFAVTEPDAGLDTTALKVRAERRGDHYVLSGQKILDLHRPGREQDPDPRPHHAARAGQAQDRGLEPVLHRSRPQQGRHPRDRQDGPPRRRLRTRCSSTAC